MRIVEYLYYQEVLTTASLIPNYIFQITILFSNNKSFLFFCKFLCFYAVCTDILSKTKILSFLGKRLTCYGFLLVVKKLKKKKLAFPANPASTSNPPPPQPFNVKQESKLIVYIVFYYVTRF